MDTLSGAWTILADSALRSAILCAAGMLLAAGLMRRSSAARKHLVYSAVLLACLFLPLLSMMLPEWRVLPDWSAMPRVSIEAAGRPLAEAVAAPEPIRPEVVVPEQPRAAAPAAALAPVARDPWYAHLTVRQWLSLAWLAGVALLLLPILLGQVAVLRIRRSARPLQGGVLISAHCRMPMACGVIRQAIILPEDAQSWPASRREAVIRHESAHLRRHDCLWQQLGQLTRALYWFNPLIWLAYHRMLCEAERACDDAVLKQGSAPSDYAEHLLAIATAGRSDRFLAAAAIAMARPNSLEGRLLSILDAAHSRRSVTRSLVCLCIAILLGLAAPLAMLRAQAPSASTRPTTRTASHHVGLYIVTKPETIQRAQSTPLSDLQLSAKPLFDEKDIIVYEWPTHTIQLRPGITDSMGLQGELPFVLVVDGQRLYLGALELVSEFEVPTIYVGLRDANWPPKDAITIERTRAGTRSDIRSSTILKDALRDLYLLQENATNPDWQVPWTTPLAPVSRPATAPVAAAFGPVHETLRSGDAGLSSQPSWNRKSLAELMATDRTPNAEAKTQILQLAGSSDPYTRGLAMVVIGRHRIVDRDADGQELVANAAFRDPHPHVRRCALYGLALLSDAQELPMAKEALKDSDPSVVEMATFTVQWLEKHPIPNPRVFPKPGEAPAIDFEPAETRPARAPHRPPAVGQAAAVQPDAQHARPTTLSTRESAQANAGAIRLKVVPSTSPREYPVVNIQPGDQPDFAWDLPAEPKVEYLGFFIVPVPRPDVQNMPQQQLWKAMNDPSQMTTLILGFPVEIREFKMKKIGFATQPAGPVTIGPVKELKEGFYLVVLSGYEGRYNPQEGRQPVAQGMCVLRVGNPPEPQKPDYSKLTPDQMQAKVQEWVEDFFSSNYRDITARKTLEWGKAQKLDSGNWQIRYSYEAEIWRKDKVIQDKLFTFNPEGGFVSVADASAPATVPSAGTAAAPGQIASKDPVPSRPVTPADRAKADELAKEGWALWQQRQFAPAADRFTEAVELNPRATNAWNGLGWALFNSGQAEDALEAFTRCVALSPRHPAALNGLGQIELLQGDLAQAEKHLLAASATADAAWWGLAKLYLVQGKYAEATKWANRILKQDPNNGEAKQLLAAAQEKRLPEELENLKAAADSHAK